MRKKMWKTVGLTTLCGVLAGCRIIGTVAVVTVGAVALVGYAVYKTGETAVTGVGKAGKAVGRAVSSGSKDVATIAFQNGEFKTEYQATVQQTAQAANIAFQKAGFQDVAGQQDALSGVLTARTWDGADIKLKLTGADTQRTAAAIRVGVKGNLQVSETIHKLILVELGQGGAS